MDIQGLGGASGPNRIDLHRIQAQRPAENVHKGEVRDRAEISEEARLLSRLAEVPDIRADRVEELKKLIASGRYETAERIAKTVDKILEEI